MRVLLLDCPFCPAGTSALRIFTASHGERVPGFVYCESCGCFGPIAHAPTKRAVIEAWNRRNSFPLLGLERLKR